MSTFRKLRNLIFFAALLIISGFTFFLAVSNKPLINTANAASCVIPPLSVCTFLGCIPPCLVDTGDLKNAGKVAKNLVGKSFGEVVDVLDKVANAGGDVCSVIVDLSDTGLRPDQVGDLVKKYGCNNIDLPGGGNNPSDPPDSDDNSNSSHTCSTYTDSLTGRNALESYAQCRIITCLPGETNVTSSSYTCGFLKKCCVGKILSNATTPAPGANTPVPNPVDGNSGDGNQGGGNNRPAAPNPPSEGPGYCGDSGPTLDTMIPIPVAGTLCAKSSAEWVNRSSNSGRDPYCEYQNNTLPYYFKCPAASSTTPTLTPTPYVPKANGQPCNPIQGPWQCQPGSVCKATCNPLTASCTTGVCEAISSTGPGTPLPGCPAGSASQGMSCNGPENTISNCCQVGSPLVCKFFNYASNGVPTFACQTAPGASPSTSPSPSVSPSPVSTGSSCPDAVPGTNIHQICRLNQCSAGENPNPGGDTACGDFYKGNYKCCQLPSSTGPAGSSCNTANRLCDPSQNTGVDGQNTQCSGCGGYCVGTGTSAYCTNKYPPVSSLPVTTPPASSGPATSPPAAKTVVPYTEESCNYNARPDHYVKGTYCDGSKTYDVYCKPNNRTQRIDVGSC